MEEITFEVLQLMGSEVVKLHKLNEPPFNGIDFAIRMVQSVDRRAGIGDHGGSTVALLTGVVLLAPYVSSFDEIKKVFVTHAPECSDTFDHNGIDQTIRVAALIARELLYPDYPNSWTIGVDGNRKISILEDGFTSFDNAFLTALMHYNQDNPWIDKMIRDVFHPVMVDYLEDYKDGKCSSCPSETCPMGKLAKDSNNVINVERCMEIVNNAILATGKLGPLMLEHLEHEYAERELDETQRLIWAFCTLSRLFAGMYDLEVVFRVYDILNEDLFTAVIGPLMSAFLEEVWDDPAYRGLLLRHFGSPEAEHSPIEIEDNDDGTPDIQGFLSKLVSGENIGPEEVALFEKSIEEFLSGNGLNVMVKAIRIKDDNLTEEQLKASIEDSLKQVVERIREFTENRKNGESIIPPMDFKDFDTDQLKDVPGDDTEDGSSK